MRCCAPGGLVVGTVMSIVEMALLVDIIDVNNYRGITVTHYAVSTFAKIDVIKNSDDVKFRISSTNLLYVQCEHQKTKTSIVNESRT